MDKVNPRCCGLDVHKDSVWACARIDGHGQNVLAEIGCDMSRFPTPQHLASWATGRAKPTSGLCPGNNESAGKRKTGRTRKANRWLKGALTQAAWGASRTRRSYYSAQHRRLTTRRGVRKLQRLGYAVDAKRAAA